MSLPLRLHGRAYGPRLPDAGRDVDVELDDRVLRHDFGPGDTEVPLERVLLTLGGFHGADWQLTWLGERGNFAFVLSDVHERERLRAARPQRLALALDTITAKEQAARRRTRRTLVLLGLAVLTPVLLLGLFWWFSPAIASAVVDRMPPEVERRLGDAVYAQLKPRLQVVEQGEAVMAVQQLGARLTQPLPTGPREPLVGPEVPDTASPWTWRFVVVRDPSINAFALPGGTIVVHTGLLRAAQSAEEVAGVLAHEVQHVEQRHSLRALVHRLGMGALLSLVAGDVGAGVVSELAGELGQLQFSRAQETEADLHAIDTLRRAKIDPRGLLAFFRRQAQADTAVPAGAASLLSTHPAPAERLQALEKALAASRAEPPPALPQDWPKVAGELGP